MSELSDNSEESNSPESQVPGELVGREFLGRYRLLESVGKGGMSVVYKALHLKMDRIVAVKVLSKSLAHDEAQVRLFNKEAFASSRLAHPNTIKVFDFGESEDGYLFIVMEYLDGESLGEILRASGGLNLGRAFRVARQICKSLAEAHSVGIIHRDLKPDNIFITNIYGEEDFVKVLDFGIAKILGPDVEEQTPSPSSGRIWGSPLYLSPEHILNSNIAIQSDLYSLGCVLFEMLAGRPPFTSKKAIDVVMAHVEEKPPQLSEIVGDKEKITPLLDLLLDDLLAKDPKDRPSSAEDLLVRLDKVGLDLGVKAPGTDPSRMALDHDLADTTPESSLTGSIPHQPRNRRMGSGLFFLFAVLCIGAFIWVGNSGSQSTKDQSLEAGSPAGTGATKGMIKLREAKKGIRSEEAKTGEPKPQGPYRREFLVQSDPSGALVFLGQLELGKTPFLVTFEEGKGEEKLAVRKTGYEEISIDLTRTFVEALTPQGINLNLEKKAKSSKTKSSGASKKGKGSKKKWNLW